MGLFDRSGMPEDLNEKHEVEANFKDDDQFNGWPGRVWRWINKSTKHWEVFSDRSPRGIAFAVWPPPLMLAYALFLPIGLLFWFDFSFWQLVPLCPYPVARKWRNAPKVLWATKMDGYWRFESDGKPDMWTDEDDPREWLERNNGQGYYLSRNQLWCRRHKAVQWPIFYSYHAYKMSADVLEVGTKADRDGKIRNFYLGAKRDAQRMFWWIAFFIGENFK